MRKLLFTLIGAAVLAGAVVLLNPAALQAGATNICSPGFYKNHPELWLGTCG